MTATKTLQTLEDRNLTVANPDEDVRGRKVFDSAGQEIGEIDALLVDSQGGRVRFLRMKSGGFLGIGEDTYLIPVDAVQRIDDDHVHLAQTGEHVAGGPRYQPELLSTQDDYEPYYQHYGVSPYWTAGYVAPMFPYYAS